MRRRAAPKRQILPDPKYGDLVLAKFVNILMLDGKKNTAFKVFYTALDNITEKIEGEDSLVVFEKALENVMPHVEVRAKRRTALAMRWLVEAARNRKEKSMPARLAAELKEAKDGKGSAVKKKEDMHRMAEANKAFAHFRF